MFCKIEMCVYMSKILYVLTLKCSINSKGAISGIPKVATNIVCKRGIAVVDGS